MIDMGAHYKLNKLAMCPTIRPNIVYLRNIRK